MVSDADRFAHMLRYARTAVRVMGGASLDDFVDNETLMLAVERAVEVVGEAAYRIDKTERGRLSSVPWRNVIGMRHVLAHAYADIDHALLYRVVHDDLPPLIASLERLLEAS